MQFSRLLILLTFLLVSQQIFATDRKNIEATPDPRLENDFWTAWWITHPTASAVEYGVYHFRKEFELNQVPAEFVVNVSADNRYKLYVNGHEVCFGPARGDLAHWYYETIDIASFLQKGKNTIAAVVWNFSTHRPWAQFSIQTAFVLQGNTAAEEIINTNQSWKVTLNQAYSPITDFSHLQTFIVVGPGERIDTGKFPWGWEHPGFDATNWPNARQLVNPKPYGIGTDIDWVLTPRDIPLMENKPERLSDVRRASGINSDVSQLVQGVSLKIPARSRVSILLDNGHLTKGYPVFLFSGGKGSEIKLTYAESLFSSSSDHPDVNVRKRHRDRIDGMEIRGVYDVILADGKMDRKFSPLWYRTYRYLQIDVVTEDEPLNIDDIYGNYSAYPFESNASFITPEPLFDKIWDVGWRTARLCAQETYYDCPYYEQLQYVGDTRIQALVSLYVSGDDQLMRKALKMFDVSRIHEGITHSRYPTFSPQFIPPYSLVWINMIHDYYMLRDDKDFIKAFLPGIRSVIDWHIKYVDHENGMLGAVPYWNFVDWADPWPWDNDLRIGGVPSGGMTGYSSILTLQFAYTLKEAATLASFMGDEALAGKYTELAKKLNEGVMKNAWSNDRKLIADTPSKDIFSQHANIMGILSGAIEKPVSAEVMEKILTDKSLIQSTMYFRFYLFLAMKQTGHTHLFANQLDQWEDMLNLGLTTFAEKPEPTRSDCHAWSASPLYFFLAYMAGILPDEPGFSSVRIEPHPGNLPQLEASLPHPAGNLTVKADLRKGNVVFDIHLPAKIKGRLIWEGKEYQINPGFNSIRIN